MRELVVDAWTMVVPRRVAAEQLALLGLASDDRAPGARAAPG